MTTKSHLMSNWNLEKVYEELAKDGVRIFDKYSYVHPTKTDNKSIRLSLGRIWFNCLFPQDFDFVNEKIPKSELDKIFSKIANKYPPAKAAEILNRVQVEAFKMATLEPRSMSTEMFEPSEEWTAKQQEFVNNADDLTDKQYAKKKSDLIDELEKEMLSLDVPFMEVLNSEATGKMNKGTWSMISVSKGTTADIEGNVSRVNKSLNDGYNIREYYTCAAEARNSFYVKSTAVREPGYMARKVVMACANIKLSEDDCKSTKYLEIFVDKGRAKTLLGRYQLVKGKLKLIESIDEIVGQKIKIRSPFYCKSKNGICKTCYGELSTKLENKNIGILAGGAVNDSLVNSMMKMKHLADKIQIVDVDFVKLIKASTIAGPELSAIVKIEPHQLIAKDDLIISIDPHEYNEKTLVEYSDKYLVPGFVTMQYGETEPVFYNFPFNFDVDLIKPDNIRMNRRIINLHYSAGEVIIQKDKYIKTVNPGIVIKILDGQCRFTSDPKLLLDMLIGELGKTDSCHLETIISNMFRSEKDNKTPARLNNYKDAIVIGCKQLPHIDSWVTGLAFENVNKSVIKGLVDQSDALMNPIEKILIREQYRK